MTSAIARSITTAQTIRPAGRLLRRVATAMLLSMVMVATTDRAAGAADGPTDESQFVQRINELRASKGLGALTVNAALVRGARLWAADMKGSGGISHMPEARLRAEIKGDWCKIGENVGEGPDVGVLHDAFVASPAHLKNLVDPDFDAVGIGIVYSSDGGGEILYITQRFMDTDDVCARQDASAAAAPTVKVAGTSATRTPTELALAAPRKPVRTTKTAAKATVRTNRATKKG